MTASSLSGRRLAGYEIAYDVSSDGRRFLMIKDDLERNKSQPLAGMVVVLDWLEELKNRLGAP